VSPAGTETRAGGALRRVLVGARVAGAASTAPADLWGEATVLDGAAALARLGVDGSTFDVARHAEATGVLGRQWSPPEVDATFDLGVAAARAALDDAGWGIAACDAVVVATCTPPRITRALAGQIAGALGATGLSLDVRAGGAGGLEALALGHQLASTGGGGAPSRVRGGAAEAPSAYANPADPANALLFGDGAAAVCLEGGGEARRVVALSLTRSGSGTPFTVPGRLPPVRTAGDAPDAYRFQRPDRAYLDSLDAAWDALLAQLSAELARTQHEPALLPYAVTLPQLKRVEDATGLRAPLARERLVERGCLGVAGPLDLIAVAPRPDAFASAAVGGGIHACALLATPSP